MAPWAGTGGSRPVTPATQARQVADRVHLLMNVRGTARGSRRKGTHQMCGRIPSSCRLPPPGAKSYEDWPTDDKATPSFQEWFKRLREGPNCEAVAD
jgi:hypothetical protein